MYMFYRNVIVEQIAFKLSQTPQNHTGKPELSGKTLIRLISALGRENTQDKKGQRNLKSNYFTTRDYGPGTE
jgi:hypothetical protein